MSNIDHLYAEIRHARERGDRYKALVVQLQAEMDRVRALCVEKDERMVAMNQSWAICISERDALQSELTEVRELLSTPHTDDWFEGVRLEAGHQIGRWGTEHDAGKAPADWFWLIGYLAQKAMIAQMSGDEEKARHHTISTGAAMLNWFRVIVGDSNAMRPGIDTLQSAPAAKGAAMHRYGPRGRCKVFGCDDPAVTPDGLCNGHFE